MIRRLFSLVAVFIVAACTPAAPAIPAAPVAPVEKRAATQALTFGQSGFPEAVTPEVSAQYRNIFWNIYDSLTTLDDKLAVQPWVAEKWSQPTPTTWRFTIRKGLTFGNGDPLTAADVAFTMKLIIDNKLPQLSNLSAVTGATVVDPSTVDLVTRVPDASIPAGVSGLWVLPEKYYTAQGKSGFAAKPIGSGPYEVTDYRASDRIVFTKRGAAHPFRTPLLTTITFRNIPEANAQFAGMKTGDLQMITGIFNPEQYDALKADNNIIIGKLATSTNALFSQVENKERNTPLTDKRVRLALNYAVDKEAMANKLFRGARVGSQLGIVDSPTWDESRKPFPYDPAMAKKLLADAGYPNGFKLPVGIEFSPGLSNAALAQALQSNLRDVGVDAPLTSFEIGVYLDKYFGRNGQSKGDIFLVPSGDGNGFATATRGYYSCNKPPAMIWWCNADFDATFDAAANEPDITKRGALMRKALGGIADDAAHIYLVMTSTFVAHTAKVKGFSWDSIAGYNFDNTYIVE